ncbi:NUMOD4 domain-containing protein [Alistipes sp.]|uniref:NUMOD4 domain-containing protein n=1 Tax=Alistipes sp. TaxID=1872444 RepID=UPI003527F67E
METWKKIKYFEGYEVSDTGRVRDERGAMLTLFVNKEGRHHVALKKNGTVIYRSVDDLVAAAFAPGTSAKETGASVGSVPAKKPAKRAKKEA